MAKNSPAVADAVVDLESGAAALQEAGKEEEEAAIVDPLRAMLINLFMVVLLRVYVVVFAGLIAYSVAVSKGNWVQVARDLVLLLPFMVLNFCMIPWLKKVTIKAFATKKRSTTGSGSDGDGLNTTLLASEN